MANGKDWQQEKLPEVLQHRHRRHFLFYAKQYSF
jgi:hypothetical protein